MKFLVQFFKRDLLSCDTEYLFVKNQDKIFTLVKTFFL